MLEKIEADFEVGNLASERILKNLDFQFAEESSGPRRGFHKYKILNTQHITAGNG